MEGKGEPLRRRDMIHVSERTSWLQREECGRWSEWRQGDKLGDCCSNWGERQEGSDLGRSRGVGEIHRCKRSLESRADKVPII